MSSRNAPLTFLCLVLAAVPSGAVYAQGLRFGHLLDWHNDQIEQVVAYGYGGGGQKISVEGKECLAGGSLHFKVNDEFAFDIDETVWLDIEFYLGSADANVSVNYDRHGTAPITWGDAKQLQLPKGTNGPWYQRSLPLKRARFANLGFRGSDIAIVAVDRTPDLARPARQFTICNLALRRSYTTPARQVVGWTAIEVVDERGQPTPARMGIYDASGRLPLPSDEALTLKDGLIGATRIIGVSLLPVLPPWPVKNRSVFYTDGRYHTRLPVGEYELIVAKGPEYRLARQRFRVRANATTSLNIKLRRWTHMAAQGWYSGDVHIHYPRDSEHDDHTLQLVTRAEDLNVATILEVENSAGTTLASYNWNPVVPDRKAPFVLVPGREGPRTSRRGHALQLNPRAPVRDTAHYLLYHRVFEQVRGQGGITGYAHVPAETLWHNAPRGLAIDVPFGLVDVAEIMSLGVTDTAIWFDFLNLGYKLSPVAGTDYPVCCVPGTVRNYVHLDQRFTPQAWFDGLKQGRTFITSGPMLDISVNGHGMGAEVRLRRGEPLVVQAKASINPDLDALASLELIEQGEVVKSVSSQGGAPDLEIRHDLPARDGTWFVVRARGKRPGVIAVSGPIYVFVDGQHFWKRSEVPSIVAKLKSTMEEIFSPNQLEMTEPWEAGEPFTRYWKAQQGALKERIDQANALYDDLVRRAARSADQP